MPETKASDGLHRLALILAIAAVVAVVDLFTTSIAEAFPTSDGSVVLTTFFNLRLGYNTGISFGLFRATSQSFLVTMLAVQSLIITGLFVFAVRSSSRLEQIALSLIIGGALGIFVDRIQNGAVRDFLDLHLRGWHWPTFNVADIAVTCGAVLLIVVSMRSIEVQSSRNG